MTMTITTHKCWHESHLSVLMTTPTILTWISQLSKCWQEPHLKRVNCNWAAFANCNWWPQLTSVDRSRTWCWTRWLLHLTLWTAIIYILFNFLMYAIYSVNIIIILLLGFNIFSMVVWKWGCFVHYIFSHFNHRVLFCFRPLSWCTSTN